MPMTHRTMKKRTFVALMLALAVLLASPPDIMAQGVDAHFETQGFGDGYAYGFSHQGFGLDFLFNLTHQSYGSDYNGNFTHQGYGSNFNGVFNHEGFGSDYNGNFNHQGFGNPLPLGSGLVVLLAASAGYTVVKRRRSSRHFDRSR